MWKGWERNSREMTDGDPKGHVGDEGKEEGG